MSDTLTQFDFMLTQQGPVALIVQEWLEPAAGSGTVFFPPTFAPPEDQKDKPAGYVVEKDGASCLVDTVGAQANRMEPLFKTERFGGLVPQVNVHVGNRVVNLLDAGHRAADAVIRFSSQSASFQQAFLSYDQGDATALAKLSPTSLVFGAWDSRDTQVKIPRLVDSTIRAFQVEPVSRNGQYSATLRKSELQEMGIDAEALGKDVPAAEGLVDNPVKLVPGGVIAHGGIRRDAVLNLIPLRALDAESADKTLALRRYVLGLGLLALFAPADLYLRQGCILVANRQREGKRELVSRQGVRDAFSASFEAIEAFAWAAAEAFGVGVDIDAVFQPGLVREKQAEKSSKKAAKAKAGK